MFCLRVLQIRLYGGQFHRYVSLSTAGACEKVRGSGGGGVVGKQGKKPQR